jgi:hypothetical protein
LHEFAVKAILSEEEKGMDIFAKLALTARRENTDGELPDFILPLLIKVADNPTDFTGREELVAELVMRVEQYETWSEMCCEKQGFSLEDIHRTLDRLKVRY